MPVVYQIPQGLQPALYNGMSFLDEYQRDEGGWYTWIFFASETTEDERFPTEVPNICVVPRCHLPGGS